MSDELQEPEKTVAERDREMELIQMEYGNDPLIASLIDVYRKSGRSFM